MSLLTVDFPLAIHRSRLAWHSHLTGWSVANGRVLTPALMHPTSHDALLVLPHRGADLVGARPGGDVVGDPGEPGANVYDGLWDAVTPSDVRALALTRPHSSTVRRLDEGLLAILAAHEDLPLTRAHRAIAATAHAARAHLSWLCEAPSVAVLAAQDALSLQSGNRVALEVSRKINAGARPRWRLALDAPQGATQGRSQRAS